MRGGGAAALGRWFKSQVLDSERRHDRRLLAARERCRELKVEPPSPDRLERPVRSALHPPLDRLRRSLLHRRIARAIGGFHVPPWSRACRTRPRPASTPEAGGAADGGLNRPSQCHADGGCHGRSKAAVGQIWPYSVDLAGAAADGMSRRPAPVLARHRRWAVERGCGSVGGRVAGGGGALVARDGTRDKTPEPARHGGAGGHARPAAKRSSKSPPR